VATGWTWIAAVSGVALGVGSAVAAHLIPHVAVARQLGAVVIGVIVGMQAASRRSPLKTVAAILVLAWAPAQASEITSKQLRAECEVNSPLCAGYVAAIVDVFADSSISSFRACVPTGIPLAVSIKSVTSFMRTHPEEAYKFPHLLVAEALAEIYPCPRSVKKPKPPA
jgi:hypothetical protein